MHSPSGRVGLSVNNTTQESAVALVSVGGLRGYWENHQFEVENAHTELRIGGGCGWASFDCGSVDVIEKTENVT